jgi:hypothetical protein
VMQLPFYYLALLKTVKLLDIIVMTGMVVREITGNQVIGESGGERVVIDADKVVLAVGIESNSALATQLKGLGVELFTVGDCREAGKLAKAVKEGFNAGLAV